MLTQKRRFYTPYEVAQHTSPTDCWVSFLGGVFDITELIKVGFSLKVYLPQEIDLQHEIEECCASLTGHRKFN